MNMNTEDFNNSPYKTLKLSQPNDTTLCLTFSRPLSLNALNEELFADLEECLDSFNGSSFAKIKCLLFQGEGKAFVAGADIKELISLNSEKAFFLSQRGQKVFSKIEKLPFVTVALIHGFALGGGLELALSCDFILAAEGTQLGLPEVGLGLIPGYGGTQRLSRSIGLSKAKRMVLTGERISAQKAYEWGLITEVFPFEILFDKALLLSLEIQKKSKQAIQLAKRALQKGFELPLEEGLKEESHSFSFCFNHEEAQEGLSAFIEKRPPQF